MGNLLERRPGGIFIKSITFISPPDPATPIPIFSSIHRGTRRFSFVRLILFTSIRQPDKTYPLTASESNEIDAIFIWFRASIFKIYTGIRIAHGHNGECRSRPFKLKKQPDNPYKGLARFSIADEEYLFGTNRQEIYGYDSTPVHCTPFMFCDMQFK